MVRGYLPGPLSNDLDTLVPAPGSKAGPPPATLGPLGGPSATSAKPPATPKATPGMTIMSDSVTWYMYMVCPNPECRGMPSCDAWEVTSAEPPAKRPKVCEEDDSGSDPRSHFNPPFKIFLIHIPNAKCWVCGEKYSSPYIRLRQSLPEGSGVSAGSFIKMQCQCCPQPPSPDFSRSPMANPMPPHELRQLGNNSRSMRFGHPGCNSSRGSGGQDATCATGLRMPHPLQMCHSLCPPARGATANQ